MKLFLSLLIMIVALPSFAAEGYKLKMSVLLDGKVVSSPIVMVQKGKKATVTQENSDSKVKTEISIVANEGEIQGNKGILLDMELANILGDDRKIVSKPQVLVSEGKEALFETFNGKEKLELKVIATKINI